MDRAPPGALVLPPQPVRRGLGRHPAELGEHGVDAARVAVVHNGTDPVVPLSPGTSATPMLATVGRLVPHKQVEHAIDVAVALRDEHPGLELHVVGGGWWDDELRAHAERVGAGDTVVFEGHVDEARKHEVYEKAWLHLMPSLKEGWGLVIGEAGVHGTPTIAYASAGGVCESIDDGRSGLLVDDPHGCSPPPAACSPTRAERARLAEGARAMSHSYSWDSAQEPFARSSSSALEGVQVGEARREPELRDRAGAPADAPTGVDRARLVACGMSHRWSPTGWRPSLRRSVRLLNDFRYEQPDPDRFYGALAADSVGQLGVVRRPRRCRAARRGRRPGLLPRRLPGRGRDVLGARRRRRRAVRPRLIAAGTVVGSGMQLPFRDGCLDVCYSSNVLEHVPDPWLMADEMVRVTKPGGLVFLSYTVWFGPWGGHETAPWHFLGGACARRRYRRTHGKEPKNKFGESLFAVTVAAGVGWARRSAARPDVELVALLPRYHPWWARWVVRVPVVRELVTWNLVVVLRKR